MGKKLYKADAKGGIGFQSDRKPGEVRVPNYVYDLWMPLLGITDIGVYAVYCRLEMEGVVKKITLDDIAKACRMSKTTLYKINARLMDCGFVTIKSPKGHERAVHMTTEITVHDPPHEVSPDLIKKYQPESGYITLTPWLMTDERKPSDVPPSTSHSQPEIVDDYKNGVLPSTSDLSKSDVPPDTSRRTEQYADDVPPSTSIVFATLELQPSEVVKTTTVAVVVDNDAARVAKTYEQNIGLISPIIKDKIKDAIQEYSADWIVDAIQIAVTSEKRFWNYVEGVLRTWKREGRQPQKPLQSSAKVSPNGNGKKQLSANNPMRRFEKASGE